MQNISVSSVWKFIKNYPYMVLGFIFIVGFSIYCEVTFPDNLRDLVPEKFESHPPRNLTRYARSFKKMQPTIYNNTLASMCEDVEINSNDRAYCINENSDIIEIDTKSQKVKKIGKAGPGRTYGLRLSKDEQFLYFANSEQGLCQFSFKTNKATQLVSQYRGEFLLSLNSIQVHPTNPDIIYVTQSSTRVPLQLYMIDMLMNNPFGRLFEYNKESGRLSLITDGLYFANGLTFQMYKGEETVLVAESNRFRLTRVFLNGYNRGMKKTAVDKLDVYLDNVKANEKGEIWVAGPSMRSWLLYQADHRPWIRRIFSRIPPQISKMLAATEIFGGLKVTFSQDKQTYKVEYIMWKSLPDFSFATMMQQKNDKLYVSSLSRRGVIVFDNLNENLKKTRKKKFVISSNDNSEEAQNQEETVDQGQDQDEEF